MVCRGDVDFFLVWYSSGFEYRCFQIQLESRNEQSGQQVFWSSWFWISLVLGVLIRGCVLCSFYGRVKLEVRVFVLWEFIFFGGDFLFCCVVEINECELFWIVFCGIYIDCQDIEESYCQCIRGYEIDFQEMFINEINETCDGKNDFCIFYFFICEVGVICFIFIRRVVVLIIVWCFVFFQFLKFRILY